MKFVVVVVVRVLVSFSISSPIYLSLGFDDKIFFSFWAELYWVSINSKVSWIFEWSSYSDDTQIKVSQFYGKPNRTEIQLSEMGFYGN